MQSRFRKVARLVFRAVWFGGELFLYAAAFVALLVRHGGKPPQRERSRWLQWCSRRTLRIASVRIESSGPAPVTGLLVCNHLSYLDILVLVALTPAVFVSKSEIRHWPVFGWFARLSGTLFVDRARRGDVARMNAEIQRALAAGNVVVLFPEGTSSNGRDVLPFKSSLLQPVADANHPLTVGHLGYALADGSVEDEVCYWRDMTFLPHIVNLMTKKELRAWVRFAAVPAPARNRKELAIQLRDTVLRLGEAANG